MKSQTSISILTENTGRVAIQYALVWGSRVQGIRRRKKKHTQQNKAQRETLKQMSSDLIRKNERLRKRQLNWEYRFLESILRAIKQG